MGDEDKEDAEREEEDPGQMMLVLCNSCGSVLVGNNAQ